MSKLEKKIPFSDPTTLRSFIQKILLTGYHFKTYFIYLYGPDGNTKNITIFVYFYGIASTYKKCFVSVMSHKIYHTTFSWFHGTKMGLLLQSACTMKQIFFIEIVSSIKIFVPFKKTTTKYFRFQIKC